MRWDAQVSGWLDDVLAAIRDTGLADLVEATVADVWERNVDRYDPVVAGDTATSLGITASENIRTLLLRVDRERWAARGVVVTSVQQALVLRIGVRRMPLMKVADRRSPRRGRRRARLAVRPPVGRRQRRPQARRGGQRAAVRALRGGPDGPDVVARPVPGAPDDPDDPDGLRHLVLVWAGDPVGGTTAGWLGVPYAGPPGTPPWLAITPVWHHGPGDVPRPREPIVAVPRAGAGRA